MNYNDPFGIQQSTPLSRTLRLIELQGNLQLYWPEGYFGNDFVASINEVNTYASGFAITLPDAEAANEGTGMLFGNRGAHSFTLKSFDGTVLTTFDPGQIKYLYCVDNSTHAGVWRITSFGMGTHAADAVALAGPGVAAIGGRLTTAYPVTLASSNVVVSESDRAKLFVANAGSLSITLPPYTIGSEFFISAKNSGSGSVTITAPSGTIDGSASLVLAPNESAVIVCSGTPNWYTVGLGRSTEFQFTKLVKDISAGGSFTLTSAEASNKLMQFIGNPASNVTIVVPSVVGIYYVQNSFTGPNTLTLKTASGSGVALSPTDRAILYCDGVNVVAAQSAAVGTNVSVLDGSLVAPAINFSADPNTGIYRADVDTIGLSSNGVEAARFHQTRSSVAGNFGIGTNNPATKLHVFGTASNELVRLQCTNGYIGFWHTNGITRFGFVQAAEDGPAYVMNYGTDSTLGRHDFYIAGSHRAGINSTGIFTTFNIAAGQSLSASLDLNVGRNAAVTGNLSVGGNIVNLSGQAIFAGLGSNTFSGPQYAPINRNKILNLGSLFTGVQVIDLSLASTFSATMAGSGVTFSFTNKPPATYDQTVYLRIFNGGTYPPNWPAGTRHPKGIKPVLSTGLDLLAIWYDPWQDNFVVGKVWEDYK